MLRSTVRFPVSGCQTTVASVRQLSSRCHHQKSKPKPKPAKPKPESQLKKEENINAYKSKASVSDILNSVPHAPAPEKAAVTNIKYVPNQDIKEPGGTLQFKALDRYGKHVDRALHAIWLRDHCQCPECVHPVTKQRQIDTFSIPKRLYILNAEVDESKGKVDVWFSDGHHTTYTMNQLIARISPAHDYRARNGPHEPILWGREIKKAPPVVDYKKVMTSDEGVRDWTYWIKRYGFCYVDGCPVTPEATQELLERIAFIRHTHYGGFWDFTADMASNDTAYTNLALGAHTDNTYFTDPARLQMFHLLSHEGGEGGESLLVDGFKVAMDLKKEAPRHYEILTRTKFYSHASGNEGISIFPQEPEPAFRQYGRHLYQIRWNNYDRDGLQPPVENWPLWYQSARTWDRMLKDPKNEYWEQLIPGRPLIFDNWRILHGRSAFTGQRRLCGGYINSDDFMARYRALNFPNKGIMPWMLEDGGEGTDA
ncbi:trimethyllysine dioxygenase [Phyllosticta capitalensis]|uniref:trimethyllysine dioxygenase n=1 Tax=Phyllosticta capitalensis TaxID=121624 RepID=A0ABR1YTY9_9PEZI